MMVTKVTAYIGLGSNLGDAAGNVQRAVQDLGITYPVAVDSNLEIWRAFDNEYWPAHYFIDKQGRIRYHHFGEGEYDKSESVIQALLAEAGYSEVPHSIVNPAASGAQDAPDLGDLESPETYIGSAHRQNFVSEESANSQVYTTPANLERNQWGLVGKWKVADEQATLERAPGKIIFRFHARDLHLVLGPAPGGEPIRCRITMYWA